MSPPRRSRYSKSMPLPIFSTTIQYKREKSRKSEKSTKRWQCRRVIAGEQKAELSRRLKTAAYLHCPVDRLECQRSITFTVLSLLTARRHLQ